MNAPMGSFWRSTWSCYALTALFFALSLILFAWTTTDKQNEIVVDAEISSGSLLEIYLNGSGENIVQPRVAGRSAYKFTHVPFEVHQIRLDFTEIPDATVKFYSIVAQKKDKELFRISGTELFASLEARQARIEMEGESVKITSLGNDPIIVLKKSVAYSPGSKGIWIWLSTYAMELATILALAGLLFLGSRWIDPLLLHTMAVVLCTCAAGYFLAPHRFEAGYQDVSTAIGYSSFLGYQKNSEFFTYKLVLLAVLLISVAFGFLSRRVGACLPELVERVQPPVNFFKLLVCALVPSIFFFVQFFPPVHYYLVSLTSNALNFGYDAMNGYTWAALRLQGYLPHRDYWFPYGGFDRAMFDIPFNQFRWHLHWTLVLFVTCLTSFLLLSRKLVPYLLCVISLFCFQILGYLNAFSRYGMGLTVITTFVSVVFICPGIVSGLLMGAYFAYVATMELNQLIYSAPGILILAVLGWQQASKDRSLFIRTILASLSSFIPILTLWIFQLYRNDQLTGLINFYSRGGSIFLSSSVPSDIYQWLALHKMTIQTVLLTSILAVLALTISLLIRTRLKGSPAMYAAFGLGTVGASVFLKQLLRPHIADQLIILPLFAIFLIGFEFSRSWGIGQKRVFACFTGFLLAAFVRWDAVQPQLRNLVHPLRILPDLQDIAQGESYWLDTERKWLEPERFTTNYKFVSPLLAEVSAFQSSNGRAPYVYALGDDAFVYPILNQRPPRFITFYNSSDARDQSELAQWVADQKPDFVIWNPKFDSFDGVPNVVRVPLLYRYVVQNFRFAKSLGDRDLLVPRNGADLDWDYWQRTLGTTLDLGAIPALSTIQERPLCSSSVDKKSCSPVLRVELPAPAAPDTAPLAVKISNGARSYTLNLKAIPGDADFSVALEHLWLWTESDASQWTATCADVSRCSAVSISFHQEQDPYLF